MISNREMYNKYDLLGKRSQKWDNKYLELSRNNDFIAMVKHLKTAFFGVSIDYLAGIED